MYNMHQVSISIVLYDKVIHLVLDRSNYLTQFHAIVPFAMVQHLVYIVHHFMNSPICTHASLYIVLHHLSSIWFLKFM